MFAQRDRRNRVLEALDRSVKQFRTREDLYPLRIPHEPLRLADVVGEALGDEASRFDDDSLRARTILSLRWEDDSCWEVWVASLPSGLKLFCDSGSDETRILASGGRNAGDESDRFFIELLGHSRGELFGIEMSGGAPSSVRSSVARPLLVEFFVNLFEGTEAEEDIRDEHSRDMDVTSEGRDFQTEVEWWLTRALADPGRRSRGSGVSGRPE